MNLSELEDMNFIEINGREFISSHLYYKAVGCLKKISKVKDGSITASAVDARKCLISLGILTTSNMDEFNNETVIAGS